jgi:hypothetical protein
MDLSVSDLTLAESRNLCKKATANLELSPCSGFEQLFTPEIWNKEPILSSTNCYAYALNLMNGFDSVLRLEPGLICGNIYDTKSPEVILNLMKEDLHCMGRKIVPVKFNEKCPDGMYKIAVCFAPDRIERYKDYHFYRQNPDSTWSHKTGINKVSILDSDGKIIYNPEKSKRNFGIRELTQFLGYYAISAKSNNPNIEEFIRERYLSSRPTFLKKFFKSYED